MKDRTNLTELAIDVSIANISWDTHANHGTLRQRVLHVALGIASTGMELYAGVPADLLQTGLAGGAIAVHAALGLWLND